MVIYDVLSKMSRLCVTCLFSLYACPMKQFEGGVNFWDSAKSKLNDDILTLTAVCTFDCLPLHQSIQIHGA